MNPAARAIVDQLRLEPLPQEGGFYRVTWRNATASAILFLITPEEFSALHRLAQDEVWHFHAGDPVEQIQLDPRAHTVESTRLGPTVGQGDRPQVVVPAGVWQGARLAEARLGFALLGCTVSPPWTEEGFELAERAALQAAFPSHPAIIHALTR